jgi:hypothetical protein
MKIIKLFETSLDICDIEKIYQPLNVVVLDELKLKYEKKCFMSSFIIEVKNIIHCSEAEISTDHQQCIALVSVMFTALVEVYTPGNIIPVCKLEFKRPNGEFIASSSDSAIQIIPSENDKILPAFKIGDKFPIQVKDVTYGTGQAKMTVLGTLPEIKPEKFVIYKINPVNYEVLFTKSQIESLEKFSKELEPYNQWMSGLNTTDKKKFDEYIAVTYPYKTQKNSSIPKISQFNFTDIKDLIKLSEHKTTFYISYPPEISRSRPIAFILDDVSKNETFKNNIFEENPMVVITDWLTIYYNYISMIKSLCENYPSPLTDRYKALWGLIHLKKEN